MTGAGADRVEPGSRTPRRARIDLATERGDTDDALGSKSRHGRLAFGGGDA